MRQQIRLTESELNNLIMESVARTLMEEGMIDELWNPINTVKNMWNATKDAVGDDVNNAYGKAKAGVQTIGKTLGNAGRAVGNAVQSGVDAATDAYGKAKQGIGDRAKIFQKSYQASQITNQVNNLKNEIQKLQQSGVIHGKAALQAASNFIKVLDAEISRQKGSVTGTKNDFKTGRALREASYFEVNY